MKWQPVMIAFVCFLILTTIIPTEALAEEEEQEIVLQQSDQYKPVHLFMKEGNTLNAEGFMDTEDEGKQKTCPDGYVGDGFLGLGFISRVGHTYWMRVGKWESEPLGSAFTVQEPIEYVFYVRSKSLTNGEFAFNMMINGRKINNNDDPNNWTKVSVQIDDTPTRVEVQENKINLSATPLSGGDTFGMEVWCRLQGDVKLLYGSMKYPSALCINANSLAMRDVVVARKKITFIYSDSFNVPLASMRSDLSINDMSLQIEAIPAFEGGYTAVIWELEEELMPGPHVIKINLGYDPQRNETYYFEFDAMIKEKPVVIKIPGWAYTLIILAALALLAYGAYTWYDNKKLEEFMMEEGYDGSMLDEDYDI